MNVGQWLYKRSLVSPRHRAVRFHDQDLTYGEMNRRVNRLAHALLTSGLSMGDRVGILSRNCPEFLEVYFACAKAGLIVAPLNFRLAPPELAYQLKDSGLRVLFFHPELESCVREGQRLLDSVPMGVVWGRDPLAGFSTYEVMIQGQDDTEPQAGGVPFTLDTAQMIMYTSGTTGTPKGALLSHGKTLLNTLNAQVYFDLCSRDVMLVVLPLFHSGGLNIMAVPTLYAGGTVILEERFDPVEFLERVRAFQVTQAMVVPTMLNTLLKEARPQDFDLTSLRSILVGGEPASAELMREARSKGLPARQIFGQTETSILLWVPEEMAMEKAGAVGLPVFHGEVQVVREDGQRVSPGEIGEIIVKGAIQMLSYWNLPEATYQTLRDGWLHTGDLAKVDEEGYVYAVDRMGDMYISGGENIYPAEVEKVLQNHPKVFEVAIIGVPHQRWGMAGHAFVKPKVGESIAYQEISSFLHGKVAAYKIPKSMEVVEEFPKTASGKIKKSDLKEHQAHARGVSI